MLYFADNLKNNIDFFLRSLIHLSKKDYFEAPQNLEGVFESEEQGNLFCTLKDRYGSLLSQNTTRRIFLLNLYFLNIFDKHLSKKEGKELSILDIGSKNWEYVRSEYAFFKSFAKEFVLNGIELDAYRVCSNFYNRYEIAKFYTKDLQNTNYLCGDLLEHQEKYDCIIWILPFITKHPLVKWGLPLKYFKPLEMLVHAYKLLKPAGEMLIINQGEEEYLIQQELIAKMDVENTYLPLGEIEDCFGLFKNKRYCTKLIKSA